MATQVYEDEDFSFTQQILHVSEEEKEEEEQEESMQVGTLSIDSTDYQIKTGTTKIGRLRSCDIVINDATVSKLHAEIEASRGQGSVWISDLNSSNKTKLNNLILRPTRLYELKDGSVIELGRVRAIYRTYCPVNDVVIPETPAPSQQKVARTIIPNTPDSSLNNSSSVNDDGSIILGTQKDNESSIFRRPRIPQQCQSTSIDKRKMSMNESNDSRFVMLNTSDANVNESQVSIFDAETQKFEEKYKTTNSTRHDTEAEGIPTDISENFVEANTKTNKQLLKSNVDNKVINKSVIDIHDTETQNYIDDINEMETQRSDINIQRGAGKKLTTNIHEIETQNYANNTDESDSNATKSEIDKNNSQEKHLIQTERDIHDLETQQVDNNAKNILETQLELEGIARCKHTSDMESQFMDSVAKESVRANENKDKDDITDTIKDGTNHKNITRSPKSRSNSPTSLNLSSPEIEDCPSSPLNQSGHLLESSYLLEFFEQGIDKQEKIQASNMPTPKLLTKKTLSERNNVENVRNLEKSNNEENNDEDMFEAITQRVSYQFETLMSGNSRINEKDVLVTPEVPKKKRRQPQLKINDDSETDAEEYVAGLTKKREYSRILNKLSDEDKSNRNDPGTSVESEDMFDVLTQQLDNSMSKDTSDSSINQPQKLNEINGDVGSTQIINNDQDKQTNVPDINDTTSIKLALLHETSSKTVIDSVRNNQNDTHDKTTTHIINTELIDCCITENFDCENIDYELAPTQVIGENNDKEKRNPTREKDSSKLNLNDTLEQKLNEMFDNVNNDTNNICESLHMSTQCLEDILESSCDDTINKSIIGNKDTDSMPQKQLREKNLASCNQHSHNLLDAEVNTNNTKAGTNVNFSTITKGEKKNIKNTRELIKNIDTHQSFNSSQAFKADNKKVVDDNTVVKFKKKRKRTLKTRNKSDTVMEILNDDNRVKTISNENKRRSLRSSKSMKQKDEVTSEMNKQVLERDLAKLKVDDPEESTSICIPCPSTDGQRAQILDTLYEIDDDILTRLPAVRISGTFSNPASPSASLTSSMRSARSKKRIAKNKGKKRTSLRGKLLYERNIGNSQKNDKLSVSDHSNSILHTPTTVKISGFVDTSEDSETDSETKYKRFKQIADRMLNNELGCLKGQDKKNRKNLRVLFDVLEDQKSTDVEMKSPVRVSSRMIQHSSKQSNESSPNLLKEPCVKNTTYGDKSIELETKSTIAKRKISLNIVEENAEQIISKKRKTAEVTEECPVSTRSRRSTIKMTTDRQSLNNFNKVSSGDSLMIENTSFESNKAISKIVLEETPLSTGMNKSVVSGRPNVTQTKHTIDDRQITTHINDVNMNGSKKKNQSIQTKGTKTQTSQSQDKVLRILLSPIKSPTNDESQEVERIMARGPSNTQDKNLLIRESSKMKIFQRELRRRKKPSDSDTNSILNKISKTQDSDNTQLDNPMLRDKHKRFVKNSIYSPPETIISESNQDNMESDTSTNSRVSRSKIASIQKKEKMELNQTTYRLIDENALGLNTRIESTPLMPSRTRRSTSLLSNSTLSIMKHKILFTGITEDYNKIIKTLGGSKVEDPAKCTVLVTDKVRRTYKFLCILAKGIPIVAIDWLKDSEAAARFLDWESYILKDPIAEAKFGFRLKKSLGKAKVKRLLDGYVIVLTPSIAPPPIEELKDMVLSCGGKALLRPPTKWPERAVILSREEDLPNAKKFLAKAPKTVTVQSTEFLLTGILRQEIDFDKYKLM